MIENFDNKGTLSSQDDAEDPQIVKDAKARQAEPQEFSYDERDVIIYNMGVGATETDLNWVYEQDEKFAVRTLR